MKRSLSLEKDKRAGVVYLGLLNVHLDVDGPADDPADDQFYAGELQHDRCALWCPVECLLDDHSWTEPC
jgi:hypothetical protein